MRHLAPRQGTAGGLGCPLTTPHRKAVSPSSGLHAGITDEAALPPDRGTAILYENTHERGGAETPRRTISEA
ncbi:hypothetical protein BOSEA31B_14587 [Hyphomicrobiales bacterium]|nr:hypothetical protein BOSEA31B_14587 [Hyphomicrobiales bacterium]CAH1701082.1 hypothetical protein BOSEA1005_20781 [Hyphomicrobiales bacterium]CAI0344142.1 hypothetical protein BO1005MUT1_310171 [Hyphomicrobiales bacterium]